MVHMSVVRNENGGVSMNGHAVGVVRPLKWKPRKVSAVRDFPPGCGPFVRVVSVAVVKEGEGAFALWNDGNVENLAVATVEENQAVSKVEDGGLVVDNGVVKEDVTKVGDSDVEPQTVENQVGSMVEVSGPVDNGVVNDSNLEPQTAENQVESKEEVSRAVNDFKLLSPTHKMVDDGFVKEDVAKVNDSNVEPQTVENQVGSKVDDAMLIVDNGVVKEDVAKVNDSNVESQVGSMEEVSGPVNDVKLLSPTHKMVDNGVVKKDVTKVKFPRRRVSAVRDFPPFCGYNVGEPSEEERERITGRKRSEIKGGDEGRNVTVGESSNESLKEEVLKSNLDDVNEGLVTNQEAEMLMVGKISDKDVEAVTGADRGKKVQNIGQACQELVVYTRDKVAKRRCSDDEDSEEEKVPESHKMSSSQVQRDTKNIPFKNEGYERFLKKRPLDVDTDDSRFDGDRLRFVIGLKAPSLGSPGEYFVTKGKGIPTSTTPNNSTKKKQKGKEKAVQTVKGAYTGTLEMVVGNEDDFALDDTKEQVDEYRNSRGGRSIDLSLPLGCPKSSNDARTKVRETLKIYQYICRKIIQGEEAKTNESTLGAAAPVRRVDLEAKKYLDKRGRGLDLGPKTYGPIPGVEVGDEFLYRVELALVGLHRIFQGGIDYVRKGKEYFAVSVVASGGYDNEINKPNCLVYSGAGGVTKDKNFENQKLERGNLALKNNIDLKYPVRVVRGYKVTIESVDSKPKTTTTYVYDGLYTVDECKQVPGPNGNMVFRFELNRIPGQPELAIREVKSKKFKKREGICVNDITNGKEKFPICAVNTIDDEKPPEFTYITKIVYPDWYKPVPPKGCDCVGRCNNKKCSCSHKNGGEIPYNRNGAIVESKSLVYECGPSCRCPPSCYNRVTQHGMKIHLEIFKTASRGWGVRSLSSISSGTFICEYIGELLEDTEAEKRTSNDEYLFDIGKNYSDCYPNPEMKPEQIEYSDGFTIDALNYANVGRFINHSCSPNLYAQNVLYDQEDKRMPHIMLFAAENIPPLQELTYHYNYEVGTVHDSDGNVKIKNCYCGSSECRGRLY